jgi:ATP-dependent 26S proteasome regulatory subunit
MCRKEKTGVDRFSLRQAVIFICATNRPDELDLEFVRSGRIDRRLYIGLPDAKQRVEIFGVHSVGKQLAEDVDFGKVSGWCFMFFFIPLWTCLSIIIVWPLMMVFDIV